MLLTRVLFRFDSVRAYYQSRDDLFAALRPAYMARLPESLPTHASVAPGQQGLWRPER